MSVDGKQLKAGSVADSKLTTPYIKADGTRAFTGAQSMGSFKLTNLASGTAATDAVNKGQLDAAVDGLSWQAPVTVMYYVGTRTIAQIDALTPAAGWSVVAGSAGTPAAGTSDALAIGDIAEFDGTSWIQIAANVGGFPAAGTRAAVAWPLSAVIFAPLTNGTDEGKLAQWDGTSLTPNLTTPLDGWAVLCAGSVSNPPTAYNENKTFAFGGIVPNGSWNQTAAGIPYAGVGEVSTVNAGDTASAGASTNVSRGDHQHAVATAAPSTTLSATTSNTEGTSTSLARADHIHAVSTGTPSVTIKSEASTASTGSAATLLRTDAQILASTATPGTAIQSDAASASQGSATSLLRSDAGLVATTAAPSNVGTTNTQGTSTSLARADHIHKSPTLYIGDKALVPAATTGNDFDTTLAITNTPALDSYVEVKINGVAVELGDGVKTKACYFTGDGGSTARAISAIIATDALYWNGTIEGYDLAVTDLVSFGYLSF